MLVNKTQVDDIVALLSVSSCYGLDTETSGLEASDRLFSIIFADEHQAYYFNFNADPDHRGNKAPAEYILSRTVLRKLAKVLSNEASTFCLHNAKYDMRMLAKEGLYIRGTVHCTLATERLIQNNYLGHKPYSLGACALRRGLTKDSTVEEYIKEHKLSTKKKIPGKEKLVERLHFDKVPFPIISTYGENDARITRAIGLDQTAKITTIDSTAPTQAPKVYPLFCNERELTKTCWRMEDEGVSIDIPYTQKALAYTKAQAKRAYADFQQMTGLEYQNSAQVIKGAFEKLGIELPKTRTGKPCTDKNVLNSLENPLADKIREIRKFEQLEATYFSSFLYFGGARGVIHPDMRQAGTETGRFSYADPNLQNVPKEDESDDLKKPFIVRKCFVPKSPEFCFVPIDFDQQEFRLMLDYAGEKEMIEAVNAGMDVHEATAQLVHTTRKKAKTLNFGLLYGMGIQKLAKALGIEFEEAVALRAQYFSKLPKVQQLIKGVMAAGQSRGYIWNWFGFRNHISSSEYAYVLPNHLIQGSGAQVIRVAMTRVDEHIRKNRLHSAMILQVHDELLFQVHRSELHHVPEFKRLMENVYQSRNGLKLTCSVEHSWKSWGKIDMIKGLPLAA